MTTATTVEAAAAALQRGICLLVQPRCQRCGDLSPTPACMECRDDAAGRGEWVFANGPAASIRTLVGPPPRPRGIVLAVDDPNGDDVAEDV